MDEEDEELYEKDEELDKLMKEIDEDEELIPHMLRDILPALAAGNAETILGIFERSPEKYRESGTVSALSRDLTVLEVISVAKPVGSATWTMDHLIPHADTPRDKFSWHRGVANGSPFLIIEINDQVVLSACPNARWDSAPGDLTPEIKAKVEQLLGRLE